MRALHLEFALGFQRWWRGPALQVFCDGSAHERPALPGGWAFVVIEGEALRIEDSGGLSSTTNNEMELHAALAGVRALVSGGWHRRTVVELVSDSRLTLDVARGVPAPRAHAELGADLRRWCVLANVQTRWVRGHSGDRWNEYVDAAAHKAKQALVPLRIKNKKPKTHRRDSSREFEESYARLLCKTK